MASKEEALIGTPVTQFKYSKRVLLKTILNRDDGGLGFVGERIVIGGWVKSSKGFKKEPLVVPSNEVESGVTNPKDLCCSEIFQSRIRSILRVLGGSNFPAREKVDLGNPKPQIPSISILQVSDGSCVSSLQVLIASSLASPQHVMPTGTSILVEGVIKQPSGDGKHVVEFHAEKILHVGSVDFDKYPLSKKQLPLVGLRDFPHFRPRTTTVATVMRIRSSLTYASESFFQNHGFLHVQVPIITTTDSEPFFEKFRVRPVHEKHIEKEEQNENTNAEIEGLNLDSIQAAIKKKSNIVEELERSESNREALVIAVQDLEKTKELALQLEAIEKSKLDKLNKDKKVNLAKELFSRESYLTVSGGLHLESYACSLGNVYSFGPTFRAGKSDSSKRVFEMWRVDLEMAFSELEDVMNCAEDYLKFLCKWILENCSEEMSFVSKRIDKSSIDRLQSITSTSFEKISYTEAVDILKKITDKIFKGKLEWGHDLSEEHTSYLVDEIYKKPLIIYNYPREVKPFYTRLNDDKKTVAAFELIVPMIGTLITGSQKEERINILDARIKEMDLAREQYEWYLDLRRHGAAKNSGLSFEFDLMVLLTTGLTDVRDVIPFPRSLGSTNH